MSFRKVLAFSFVLVLVATSFAAIATDASDNDKTIVKAEKNDPVSVDFTAGNIGYSFTGEENSVWAECIDARDGESVNSIVIPDTVTLKNKSFVVTGVDDGFIYNSPDKNVSLSSIKTISIGKNVRYIGSYAFQGCQTVTDVTLHCAPERHIKMDNFEQAGYSYPSLCEGCFDLDDTLGNGMQKNLIQHRIHSPNNWVMSKDYVEYVGGDLESIFGSDYEMNFSFDANVGQGGGINYLLIIGVVIVVGLIAWCIASRRH